MNCFGSGFRASCFAVVLLFSSAVARAQLGTVVLDDEFTDGRVDSNQGAGGIVGGFAVARVDAGGQVREQSSFLILSQTGGGRVASVRCKDSYRFYHTNGVEVFWQLAQIQAPPTGVRIILGVYRLDLPSGAAPVAAVKTIVPAWEPFVQYIFAPLTTHSGPSRTAVVFVACASEPASGSVRPNAPIISPLASFGT